LPGKVEFSYLPLNAQAVVVLPVQCPVDQSDRTVEGAVVVAANRAKVFKLDDLTRLRALVAVAQSLWTR
jgi:hypothetical protein